VAVDVIEELATPGLTMVPAHETTSHDKATPRRVVKTDLDI
jgi:hypothetical protein